MTPTGPYGLGVLLLAALAAASHPGSWPLQSYQTESFNIPYFNVTRQGEATGAGDLFLGIVHPAVPALKGPFIAQDTGDLIWKGPTDANAYYNFQAQTIKNQDYITYWTGYLDYSGHGYGAVTVLDNTYSFVKKICFPDSVFIQVPRPKTSFPAGMPDPCYVDKHESLVVTDRNTIIVTAYNATQTDLTALKGPKDGWVYDCLFFELDLDTNEVLFQWSALDHVPVTKSNFIGRNKNNPLFINKKQFGHHRSAPWDFFHINSVDVVPGGYIANSRMTWSFYKIDAKTGNVTWTLEGSNGGDFKLISPIFFSWQHHVRLQGMSKNKTTLYIHLFNNDNIPGVANGKNASSGYFFNVDESAMTVKTRQFYQDEVIAPPILAAAEGSVQTLLNGHHLVGYGERPYIQEYDANAQCIYNGQFGTPKDTTHSYRAYRRSWVGSPITKPKVVASVVNGSVVAYMSWNGATEYTSWNVYAGDTMGDLTRVHSAVAKNGFETSDTFGLGNPDYQYVMAEALDTNSVGLANSTVESIDGATQPSTPTSTQGALAGIFGGILPTGI